MGRRENKVETHLKKEVTRIGGISRKWVSPQHAYVPDQIVVYKGIIWFIEVKAFDGKLSSGQEREITKLREHGANALSVAGIAQVDSFITMLEASR
jgi:hypothetical protein